jgi:hypothetical protein
VPSGSRLRLEVKRRGHRPLVKEWTVDADRAVDQALLKTTRRVARRPRPRPRAGKKRPPAVVIVKKTPPKPKPKPKPATKKPSAKKPAATKTTTKKATRKRILGEGVESSW